MTLKGEQWVGHKPDVLFSALNGKFFNIKLQKEKFSKL